MFRKYSSVVFCLMYDITSFINKEVKLFKIEMLLGVSLQYTVE